MDAFEATQSFLDGWSEDIRRGAAKPQWICTERGFESKLAYDERMCNRPFGKLRRYLYRILR